MMTISETVSVNGLNTAYTIRETVKPGHTVVFIHGFPFNRSLWDTQLEALPSGISGVSYDIRGFGESEPGHQFFSIDLFARDLESLIAELKLERVVLCGISMGGYIALRAVERAVIPYAGLVLCDTTSAPDTNETKLARFDGIELVLSSGVAAYADKFVQKLFNADVLESGHENVQRIKDMINGTSATTICSALLAMASRTDTTPFLPAIDVPVQVIRGAGDQVISPAQAEALHQNIGGSGLSVISSAGHLPNLDQPEAFNRILNTFLESLPSPA